MTAYRGWAITFDYGYYWATSPNYDASWEGAEDGWVDNGERCCAREIDDLYAEVDAWFEEHCPSRCSGCGVADGHLHSHMCVMSTGSISFFTGGGHCAA